MYDKLNVPKWLQDCMLPVDFKWNRNQGMNRSSDQGVKCKVTFFIGKEMNV